VPLYEYECQKCGRRTEKIENVSGPHLKKCPHCGGKVEALISAPAIQFKGSGWYVTDYAGKSAADKPDKGDKSKEDGASGEKKEAAKDSTSKDSSAKESSSDKKSDKPAKKK
jgi:putative FmdB family regulatory protein